MLPGFDFILLQEDGTQTFSMTAGGTSQPGYVHPNAGFTYGSISVEPFPPATLRSLFSEDVDGTLDMRFFGDYAAALSGYSGLEINGTRYQFQSTWIYDSGLNQTIRRSAINTFNFVIGSSYTCKLVA